MTATAVAWYRHTAVVTYRSDHRLHSCTKEWDLTILICNGEKGPTLNKHIWYEWLQFYFRMSLRLGSTYNGTEFFWGEPSAIIYSNYNIWIIKSENEFLEKYTWNRSKCIKLICRNNSMLYVLKIHIMTNPAIQL